MKYHLDRALTFNTTPEHKSLYQWAINEAVEGNKASSDQIPWEWTINFRAIDCSLSDGLNANRFFVVADTDRTPTIEERQNIRMSLRCDDGGSWSRRTRFSMFGTGRETKNIRLEIYKAANEADKEVCVAWGIPSYTLEIDFRNVIQEDIFGFRLTVKPSTFERFVATLTAGGLDNIAFSAGRVSGFYSGWSPGISTDSVKILTADKEQRVEGADERELPRLKEVGEFALSFNRKIDFERPAAPLPANEDDRAAKSLPASREPPATAGADLEIRKLLKSLQTAAWCVAALLTVLVVRAVLH